MNITFRIKDLPVEERPRERVIKYGIENLSNIELLTLIIKCGTKDKSASTLAIEVLKELERFEQLSSVTLEKLQQIKGIGPVKAIEIMASVELGKRLIFENKPKKLVTYRTASSLFEDSKYFFYGKKQEYFYCFYFNQKQQLLERKLLFIGTINQSIVHPREIFKNAYLLSASSIICMHNHPSGDVTPSYEDVRFTKAIVEIGKIQHILIVDHIIVSDLHYYSFCEHHNIIGEM